MNNIVFVCKSYYFECLIKELGINNNTSSFTTYKSTSFDKDEILALLLTQFYESQMDSAATTVTENTEYVSLSKTESRQCGPPYPQLHISEYKA
jgi:hypothetical protein